MAETWHHGLIARYWAEFNDAFRPHEAPYFERRIRDGGGPALDVGCGTGRLLIPYLRAGLDVDGCDASGDMVALCREKAQRDGLEPTLWAQPMHQLEAPRRYRTIYVCGAFGLGSTRDQDVEALRRFHAHLDPGGTLLVDIEMPYADARLWPMWMPDVRSGLPEADEPPRRRERAADGSEYALRSRVVALDPLAQQVKLVMRAQLWRDGVLAEEEEHTLTITMYFAHELAAMVERAGFSEVVLEGDHNGEPATPDDDFVVVVARR